MATRDNDFTLGDHYSTFVQLDAKVTEVAKRWARGGYERFERLAASGVHPQVRMDAVEAHLRHIGTEEALRDVDAIFAALQKELEVELAPKPPTRAQRSRRLMERVAAKHVRSAGPAPAAPIMRQAQVRSAPAPKARPVLKYDVDGVLLDPETGERVESRPLPPLEALDAEPARLRPTNNEGEQP